MLISRRLFMGAATGFVAAAPCERAFAAIPPGGARSLSLDNLHTGEKLSVNYWVNGAYQPDALAEVDRVLRDFRTGDIHPIAPTLLDLLTGLRLKLDSVQPFEVISGYRSPKTNAILREAHEHSGVASQSLHMQGMAIDVRVPGRALASLRDAALAARGGGVGYYPASDFVHVDVGRVRRW